jgi:hypothetical protein
MATSKTDNSEDDKKDTKKVFSQRSATDIQRFKLQKLLKNPEKPVFIPEKSEPKLPRVFNPPEFVRNIWGSSAGAGSGDFHVYRGIRRREYARQKFMNIKAKKDELDEDFQKRLAEHKKAAIERTDKKRAKRMKKKQKAKNAKKKKLNQKKTQSANGKDESESSEESESEEEVAAEDSGRNGGSDNEADNMAAGCDDHSTVKADDAVEECSTGTGDSSGDGSAVAGQNGSANGTQQQQQRTGSDNSEVSNDEDSCNNVKTATGGRKYRKAEQQSDSDG